ncbi:MAG: DUF1579 domain-containing protein [Gemmataceae bacterium]
MTTDSRNGLVWAGVVLAALVAPAGAQEVPKPGPEHEMLAKLAGTWDTTMKAPGMESKGTATYKMELGGIWLGGVLESELFGTKFTGKSLESYHPAKKKYVSVWVDSMSTAPVTMEGTYDEEKKTLTMAGEGPAMEGKMAKYKSVSKMPDADTLEMTMWIGDGKEPAFTIVYKRKK